MKKESAQRLKYVLADYATANVAWLLFNCLRYGMKPLRGFDSLDDFLFSPMVLAGQVLFPFVMLGVYWLSGYYNEVFRKSRLGELLITLSSSIANTAIIFLVALTNDMMRDNRGYNYELIFVLLGVFFFLTYLPRLVHTTITSRKIKSRQLSFKTLVIGAGDMAYAFVKKLDSMQLSLGYKVVGYVAIPAENRRQGHDDDRPVYALDEVAQVCQREGIQELIVIPSQQNSATSLETIDQLFLLNLPVKIALDRYNVLLSKARLSNMSGDPLIDISSSTMSEGEKNVKRALDVLFSAIMLVLLLPVFLLVGVVIKCDSKGPVFYSQKRVGRHNVLFNIYKFRSMCINAERDNKPQLSSNGDSRITRVGHVLRKYRIDELPQFWNVLRGDMSLVGPRPERQFFAQQILEREPAYSLIHQVRPGITSLGMVKYGYAKSVDEMMDRLRYDLLYIDNMSLINDLKILVYTIKIVFNGRGL